VSRPGQIGRIGLIGRIILVMTAVAGCGKAAPEKAREAGGGGPAETRGRLQESLVQAIEGAEMILKISPGDRDALLAAALAAEHLGQIPKAIQYYERLQKVTQETEYLRKLAELQQATNPATASGHASKFFEQGGVDDRLRLWLVKYHAQRNESEKAYRLTAQLAAPADRPDQEYLRDLCLREAQREPTKSVEAMTALRRAASFAPLPTHLAETVALTFLAAGDAAGAKEVLKNYPGAAHLVRAKIADRLEDAPEALAQRMKYYYTGGADPQELLTLLAALGRSPPARQVAEKLWRGGVPDLRGRLTVARAMSQFFRDAPDTPAELKFLEEAKTLGDPAFLDRLADLQSALGNARAALSALRSRHPREIPERQIETYVTLALSAGEPSEALRVGEPAPSGALSAVTRRRLAEILWVEATRHLSSGEAVQAKSSAQRADRLWPDAKGQKLLARISLQEGDTSSALASLSTALKLAPSDAEGHFLMGKILYHHARWPESKSHLQAAYAGRHAEGDLPLFLARIHIQEQNPAMAYPLLKEYAEARSNDISPDVQELLARSAMVSGQLADAVRWYERRLSGGPEERLSAELLEAYLKSGQRAKALGQARTLVATYPTSKRILEVASDVFDFATDSGLLVRSLELLTAQEQDADQRAKFQRRLLDVKLQMGRKTEANELLTVLFERYPNDPQLLTIAWNLRKGTPSAQTILARLSGIRSPTDPIQLIRARQFLEDRNFGGAQVIVRDYLAGRRDDPDGLALQAEIYLRQGQAEQAAATTRALLKLRRDESSRKWLVQHIYDQALSAVASGGALPNAGTLYGEVTELLGSEEKHKDLYEVFGKLLIRDARTRSQSYDAFQRELRLTKEGRKRQQLTETLGQWYLEDGQLSLAREMYDQSHALGNSGASFLRSYARLLSKMGDADKAAGLYRVILKDSPYDRDANLQLARRAAEQGDRAEAIRALEALRRASPPDTGVMDALGTAYAASGRPAEAAPLWESLATRTGHPKYIGRHADALYESGNYRSALDQYRLLRRMGAAQAGHLRRQAELEQGQGNVVDAEEIILGLLRAGGTEKDRADLSALLRRLGAQAAQRGNVVEATRTAERLLALNDRDPAAFLLMGRAKLLEGRAGAAVESFSRAAALSPSDARPILGLAEVELRAMRPVAAIDYARKALALDPTLPEAHTLMGLAYQRQGDVTNAYESFKQVLLHSKNRSMAHVRMGDLFLQHGKYNVALEQYRQALSVDPKNAQAHLRNAIALHKLGFGEAALKELLTTQELDPAEAGAEASVLLSEILASHGDVARARAVLELAAARSGSPPNVLFRLGEMARRNGEYPKSVQMFKDALAGTDDADLRYEVMNAMGLAFSDQGDRSSAERLFKEASRLDPGRPAAFLNLALLYRAQKDFLSAVDHARKAIGVQPNSPEGYKLLGLIYYEAGWAKESLTAFRESLRLRPEQPEIASLVKSIEEAEEE